MAELETVPDYSQEGKMYGILLVTTAVGTPVTLKGFSGLLNGQSHLEGWVPPIPGRAQLALAEAETLADLDQITAEILTLQALPERQQLAQLQQIYGEKRRSLAALHQTQRQDRHRQRHHLNATLQGTSLKDALAELDRQSQQAGMHRRQLKQAQDAVLAPLQVICNQADDQIRALKRQRKSRSRQLQAQMHGVYHLTNFAGASMTLADLMPQGLPTGTGDCAAPKLLHYAATQGWQPQAMAEFWWGPPQGDKQPGQFYGPCRDRCQPIMGFLLSGATAAGMPTADINLTLPILYGDEALIAVDKPAGLLSVPGRTGDRQDSVLSRLRCQYPGDDIQAVHRLDQATSGVLLLARNPAAHRHLSEQFQQRRVTKQYEAICIGTVAPEAGRIDLPLWGDPSDRPRQSIHFQHGKPSQTDYRVVNHAVPSQPATSHPGPQTPNSGGFESCPPQNWGARGAFNRDSLPHYSRVEFRPLTGRTHQLRVHAAQGLNAPILGDRLYGPSPAATRLHLHAKQLALIHPSTDTQINLSSPTPF
jgi:tRNA pseudouridine32 synthase/23S rRNA pseudouridine746 synthase